MGKNAYAAKLQAQRDAREYIIKLWMGQLMMDVFGITLADEEVMGKDTFGEKRLARIETAINQRISEVMPALTGGPEADYIRATVDRRLKQIKPDALPWTERYEGWEDPGIKS